MTRDQLMILQAALLDSSTNFTQLCRRMKVKKRDVFEYINPNGYFRGPGLVIMEGRDEGKETGGDV